jgi:hypothetical protein
MAPNSAATLILSSKTSCNFDMAGFEGSIIIDQGKQLTLTADNGCGGVVLDALYQGSFFRVGGDYSSPSSASLVLQGLTLRNGVAEDEPGPMARSYGGAVHLSNGTLTTKDCRLEHCTADFGGAIALGYVGVAVLHAINTTFFNNSGDAPGGSIGSLGTAVISNCTFSESSTSNAPGGAMFSDGNATITDTIFTGCAGSPGGALSVSGNATITNSTFTNCSSSGNPRHEIESPKHLPQEIAQGRLPLPKTVSIIECLRPQKPWLAGAVMGL